jgi:hypothetical protein
MDTLKDRILFLSILLSLAACSRYDFEDLDNSFNVNLRNKVKFVKVDEQWSDNGDGEKVVVFKLNKSYAKEIFNDAETHGFKLVNINKERENFTKRELKYIGGEVLYKTIFKGDEVKTLTIDTLQGKIIFYYGLQ